MQMAKQQITQKNLDQFFTKLKWAATTNEMENMATIQIDCFLFKFDEPLKGEIHYGFIEYMSTLNMRRMESMVLIAIWLLQHGVKFDLVFKWNWAVPFFHNVARMKKPKQIMKDLKEKIDEVMLFDLSQYEYPERCDAGQNA